MIHEEKLERIPRVKKIAGPADIMDREEAEYKIHPVLPSMDTVCRKFGQTEKEV